MGFPGWLSKAATLLTVLVASLAISSGCSGKREVTGQVFVVTKGGENVKLGLVGIHLVGSEELLLAAEHAVTNSSGFYRVEESRRGNLEGLGEPRQRVITSLQTIRLTRRILQRPNKFSGNEESWPMPDQVAFGTTEFTDNPEASQPKHSQPTLAVRV